MSTITNSDGGSSHHRLMQFVPWLWLVAAATALALAPGVFADTQDGWQFNEAARALEDVSYETLTAAIAGARLALTGLMLVTAALLLTRRAAGAPLAALALATLPFAFNLAGTGAATNWPQPWPVVLNAAAVILGALGITALFLLLFLFPNGRFYPAWLGAPALVGLALVLGGVVFIRFVENAWLVFVLILLALLLLGMVGQLLRYRAAGPPERRQMVAFLAVLLALPIYAAAGAFGVSPALTLMLSYALLALLPAALLIGVSRGLWGGFPAQRIARRFAGALVGLVLVAALAAAAWWAGNRPQAVDTAALAAAEPLAVVLDADMAMDDVSALLYLLQHPAVDLRAITVNGVAFAHCDGGVRAALGLLEVARAPEVPVACGREEAYPGGRPAPDAWRKSADTLYGAQVRTGERRADPRPAADLLADTIAAAPGDIVVIALGPLTNLAEAFQADPTLAGQIKQIVIMGGALDAPGNVADENEGISNQYAEWNFFADPVAADIVLASGAPIVLVPLDATNDVPFTRSFYQRLQGTHRTRPAVFIYNVMYLNQWWLDGGMYWWDTLAAAAALDESLVTLREERVDVVTAEGTETARLIRAADGAPVRVAMAANRARFEALFLAVLNHE